MCLEFSQVNNPLLRRYVSFVIFVLTLFYPGRQSTTKSVVFSDSDSDVYAAVIQGIWYLMQRG